MILPGPFNWETHWNVKWGCRGFNPLPGWSGGALPLQQNTSARLALPFLRILKGFFEECSMTVRHTGLCMALLAFLFSVLGNAGQVFASASAQVEFQKGVSCAVRVVNEGTEGDAGPWRLEITPPDGPMATLHIPVPDGDIHLDELRAASFSDPQKQELFISFIQIRNGRFSWAYVVDFSNGKASILFDSEWLEPGFAASGVFADQYGIDIGFSQLADKYTLSLEGEKKTDYDVLYDAQTGKLTAAREIAGSHLTSISVVGPNKDGRKGKKGVFFLDAAVFVAGAAYFDGLGEYVFHLRQQGDKWHLLGDTQFVPAQGIRHSRVQGDVPVARMGVAVSARGLETVLSTPPAQGTGEAPAAAPSPRANKTGAPFQSDRDAIVGFDGVLLGGFIAGQWVSAETLQGDKAYDAARIEGGEEYKVYSVTGFEGVGTGTAVHSSRLFAVAKDAQTLGFGAARLAIRSGWEAVPRQAVAMGAKNPTYGKILKDYLGRNGLPDATPQITQLFKVDLEGDGADEVVIVAQNVVGRNAAVTWEADKPLSHAEGIPGSAKKGSYSLVLVRKLVGGKVHEIPLAQYAASKNSGTPPLLHKVQQFADVNGDGVMDIILGENSSKGFSYQVYTVKGGKAEKVLANGADWKPSDSALLSAGEARKILQTWLNGHPMDPRAVLAREHKEYVHGGEAYYLFSLDDAQRYWLNFLVHKQTGELLYMMISDGEHATVEVEPLDAWYTKHF